MYTPSPFIEKPTPDNLAVYLERELQAISRDLAAGQPTLNTQVLHVAPSKPREGMIVVADGTDWDPGNGAGQYTYVSGAWVFGGYIAPDLSGYLTKADNLASVASASTARTNLGLGTAAQGTLGTGANDVVELDSSAKLPAVDGSQLTNLPSQTGRLVAGTPLVLNPYAASGTTTQAHGLGVVPVYVSWTWECLTTDLNYAVGDKIQGQGYMGFVDLIVDATNLVLIRGTTLMSIVNKTTFSASSFTAANWKLTLVPYKLV